MTRSGGKSGRSGWHKAQGMAAAGMFAEPQAPTGWELLLRRLGVPPLRALAVAEGLEPGPRAEMRSWAQKHRGNRFVPEDVLVALGLELRDADVTLPSVHIERNRARATSAHRTLGD